MKFKIENLKLLAPNALRNEAAGKISAKQAGITLFIAVIVMSILLFISFAVINVALKGTLFASSGRDSQYAFYAADSGIECALYWDSKYPTNESAFATSTITPSTPRTIGCGGSSSVPNNMTTGDTIYGTTTLTRIGGGGNANPTSVFGFVLDKGANAVPYCAIVTATKNTNGTTYIKSRGYNTCDASNLRRVERGIEVTY